MSYIGNYKDLRIRKQGQTLRNISTRKIPCAIFDKISSDYFCKVGEKNKTDQTNSIVKNKKK